MSYTIIRTPYNGMTVVLHPPDLAPCLLKLELAMKGRRFCDIGTVQEQSPIAFTPYSGGDGRHIY